MLFDDTFKIESLNPHKKRFARVDRIVGKGSLYDMDLLLDINSEIYPIKQGDEIAVMLANTPYGDGKPDPKEFQHDMGPSLIDSYEYVTYGKVFKIESVSSGGGAGGSREPKVAVMISFGGLLMKLSGEQRHVAGISIDSPIYCFIRHAKTKGSS